MNKRKAFLAIVLVAIAVVGWAAYSLNPYTPGETAGTAVSGRYEGRYLTFLESALTHPTQSDGLVNKGDIVLVGDMGIVGVALESATAATDYVAIDTEGIWNLTITNSVAMSAGDEVYVDNDAATLSDSPADGLRFGYVLSAISTTGSGVVRAVKIHNDSTVLVTINSDYIQGATDSIFTFATDDDAAMLGGTEFKSSGAGPGNNDYWRNRYYIQESDELTQVEAARIDMVATDVTSTTEDSRIDLAVITAGSLANEVQIQGSGTTLANGVTIGTNGTATDLLGAGQVTISSGASTATLVTVTGLTTADVVILTPLETLGYAADVGPHAVIEGGGFEARLSSGTAAADWTFAWMAVNLQ
jgi:predicted RecA/RadA family phage recombinase